MSGDSLAQGDWHVNQRDFAFCDFENNWVVRSLNFLLQAESVHRYADNYNPIEQIGFGGETNE